MNFAREPYSPELVSEMMPLFEKHFTEIATFKDIPLAPDLAAYDRMNMAGMLRIFTAREGTKLKGYEVFFVAKNPHYRTSVQANQDILYLDPVARKGLTAYKFIQFCDGELQREGVEVIYMHLKLKHDFSLILERLGYVDHDKVMARRVN